jgi:hypothetical protein
MTSPHPTRNGDHGAATRTVGHFGSGYLPAIQAASVMCPVSVVDAAATAMMANRTRTKIRTKTRRSRAPRSGTRGSHGNRAAKDSSLVMTVVVSPVRPTPHRCRMTATSHVVDLRRMTATSGVVDLRQVTQSGLRPGQVAIRPTARKMKAPNQRGLAAAAGVASAVAAARAIAARTAGSAPRAMLRSRRCVHRRLTVSIAAAIRMRMNAAHLATKGELASDNPRKVAGPSDVDRPSGLVEVPGTSR